MFGKITRSLKAQSDEYKNDKELFSLNFVNYQISQSALICCGLGHWLHLQLLSVGCIAWFMS